MKTIALAAALLATACSAPVTEAAPANETDANAVVAPARPQAPPAETVHLSPYVGRYPFDEVSGVTFLAQPAVRAAVEAAVPDATIRGWILERAGPQAPIALKEGRLLSWGCEAHNCGPHQWTVLIDPAGAAAEICYHEDAMNGRSRWYRAGSAPEMRNGECPSE